MRRGRRRVLPLAAVLAAGALGAGPGAARATVGFQSCVKAPSSTTPCASTAPALLGVNSLDLSADGRTLVASSQQNSAVTAFTVDPPTGALTQTGCVSAIPDTSTSADRCPPGKGGARGINYASGVAASPDGRSVYAAAFTSWALGTLARDPLTGGLTAVGCVSDPAAGEPCGGARADGLRGAFSVVVAPDGRFVYTAAASVAVPYDGGTAPADPDSGYVAAFARDTTTGALTPLGCVKDPLSTEACATVAPGLRGAFGLRLSHDGRDLYVAAYDHGALVHLRRDTTSGALTPAGCVAAAVPGCAAWPAPQAGPVDVAVSPDDRNVYVSASAGAMVVYARSTVDGALTYAGCVTGPGSAATTGCGEATGLAGVGSISVAPDGRNVYASGYRADTLVTFARDPATGLLSFVDCTKDPSATVPCARTAEGLRGAQDSVVSPDGTHLYVAGSSHVDATGALVVLARTPDSPPVVVAPAIPAVVVKTSAAGSGRLPVRCASGLLGRCDGTVTLTLVQARASSAAPHGSVRVASAPFTVGADGRAQVKFRLSASARRLLRRTGRLRVRAAVERRNPNGTRTTRVRTLVLRRVA